MTFVVAGIVIEYKLPLFPCWDFVQMAIMYIACAVIRAIVVFTIYALFKICGVELEKGDQIVTVWAG